MPVELDYSRIFYGCNRSPALVDVHWLVLYEQRQKNIHQLLTVWLLEFRIDCSKLGVVVLKEAGQQEKKSVNVLALQDHRFGVYIDLQLLIVYKSCLNIYGSRQ